MKKLINSNLGDKSYLNKTLSKISKRYSFKHCKGVFSFGFTLIELLAVIIILAVIALIATPIVLNVVDKAKENANMQTVNGILDAARLYYAESMLDSDKKLKVDNVSNIYSDVSLMNKPENVKLPSGETYSNKLYVNNQGSIATSVVLDKKCYIKKFNTEVEVTEDLSNCDLGFVGKDEVYPTLEYSYSEITGTDEWYKENMWVTITAKDNESGISEIKWCTTQSNTCEPITKVIPKEDNKILTHGVNITTESATNNVCVSVIDIVGNITNGCSDKTIKLDKTSPSFTGIVDKVVNIGTSIDLNEGITVNDVTSGISGSYTYNPTTVDTTKAGTTNVEYSVMDNAGNTTTITRKIIVDAEAPTVTFTPQVSTINSNGWSKQDFYVKVDLVDNSGLGIKEGKWCISQSNTCTPNAVISGTTLNPQISTESNNNRICIQATDNNNKQSAIICSDAYKLDKTLPITGTATFSGTLGSNSWYTSNVTITTSNGSDGLSGHNSTTSDTLQISENTINKIVTLTTTDIAGNQSTKTYTIKVDKTAPALIAKSDLIEITQGDSVDTSTYFNSPSYSISGGSMSCSPSNTSGLAIGQQTITCIATGGNGLTTTSNKTITIKQNIVSNITNDCVKAGNICTIEQIKSGVSMDVQVSPTETHKFYVLSDDGTDLTLLMDRSLDLDGNGIPDDKVAWQSSGNNAEGPITTLTALENKTNTWTNLPSITYSLTGTNGTNYNGCETYRICTSNKYAIENRIGRARLPRNQEMVAVGCTDDKNSCPVWSYDYLNGTNHKVIGIFGYWTSSTNPHRVNESWSIYHNNTYYNSLYPNDITRSIYNGIRPVITISKSNIK